MGVVERRQSAPDRHPVPCPECRDGVSAGERTPRGGGGTTPSDYDDYGSEYAAYVTRRARAGVEGDSLGILPHLLDLLGDLAGRRVLDAGCGEGYLARVLAARGARVTGIDLSPRLIALAREQDPRGEIAYRVADLSAPLPAEVGRFDAIGSSLVLNDVADYRGFAATLAAALEPGGRLVLAFNSPYGAVIRKHVADYFDSGAVTPTAASGRRASRCTTTTGRWKSTWTPSWRRACTSRSWPICRICPASPDPIRSCRRVSVPALHAPGIRKAVAHLPGLGPVMRSPVPGPSVRPRSARPR